ncbi:MAG TPA: succinate dehydrogenase, cytochrome b556 subunit [Legionellaceae bacterium]|nr:succinate dehydrogenase, cytochrome b556 subunit [Legionellaceae bacterium]
MKSKRPVNLNLTTLAYPPMAIASILHRISGIVMFLLLPFVFYLLYLSLHTQDTFHQLQAMFSCGLFKCTLWVFGAALTYHSFAGIRHLITDLGWGEHVHTARWSAYLIIILTLLSIIFLGILIW